MEHVHMSVLLETIRKGRVLLLNKQQAIALVVIFLASLATWNLVCQALPMSVAPLCPPPVALLFCAFYLPTLSLTMLFNDDHEHVMKNTPRKTNLILRPRDKSRFYNYLLFRVITVTTALYATGYVTAASVFRGDKSFYYSLSCFHSIFGRHILDSDRVIDSRGYALVQDMIANAALLSLLGQSITLLVRGQRPLKDFPWPHYYQEYYVSLLVVLVVHLVFMTIRSLLRNCHLSDSAAEWWSGMDCSDRGVEINYADLHGEVWAVLFLGMLGNIITGFVVNHYDGHFYRRYLQFLRLEFDTRLGMHSPR